MMIHIGSRMRESRTYGSERVCISDNAFYLLGVSPTLKDLMFIWCILTMSNAWIDRNRG